MIASTKGAHEVFSATTRARTFVQEIGWNAPEAKRACARRAGDTLGRMQAPQPLGFGNAEPGYLDRSAVDYDRGRPGWPVAAVEVAGLGSSATVVDVGAGTGKLTKVLASHFETVIGVEPLDGMRALLETVPGIEVHAGRAEELPLPDSSVDGVFVAEAFHWFASPEAVAELARVLRPEGCLVLMWNRPAGPVSPPLPERLRQEANSRSQQTAHPNQDYESGAWRGAFDGSRFGPLHAAQIENSQRLDREDLIAFIGSLRWVSMLEEGERERLLAFAREELDADEYLRPWRTDVYWTRLTS